MHNSIFITTEFKDFTNRFICGDGPIYSGYHSELKLLFTQKDVDSYKKFYKYIWKAHKCSEKYWFQEHQTSKYFKNTGIMIDLDAYQLDGERMISRGFINKVVMVFMRGI